MAETPIFDSLIGPSFKSGMVPTPEALTPQPSLMPVENLPRPPQAQAILNPPEPVSRPTVPLAITPTPAPISDTPIFDRINRPSDTPIFDRIKSTPTMETGLGDMLLPKPKPIPPVVENIPPITPMPGAFPRPQESIAQPPSRGWIGDIGSALTRGLAIRFPEQLGNLVTGIGKIPEALGFYDKEQGAQGSDLFSAVGHAMTEWAHEAPQKYPFLAPSKEEATSLFRRGIASIIENATAFIPFMLLPGGPVVKAATAAVAFGLPAYNQTYESAITQGKSEPEAQDVARKVGLINGTIMAAMGPLSTAVGGIGRRLAEPIETTIRTMLAPSAATLVKEGVTAAGLMMGQSFLESNVLKEAGMQTPTPGEALKESALPSIGMSILFGLASRHMQSIPRNRTYEALTQPGVPIDARLQAVDSLANELNTRYQGTENQGLGDLWKQKATEYLYNGKPVPIDENFMGFLNHEFQYQTPPSEATKARMGQVIAGEPLIPPEGQPKALLGQPTDWIMMQRGPETPAPEVAPTPAPGEQPSPVPPLPVPPSPGPVNPPGLVPPKAPEAPQGQVTPTPIPTPAVKAEIPKIEAMVKPGEAKPTPDWMTIGAKAEFYDKNGVKKQGTIRDILYSGEPPVPLKVTVTDRQGRVTPMQASEVSEPTRAIRQREYNQAIQELPEVQRNEVKSQSKEFDDLLFKNADLFVGRGMIDFLEHGATTDKKMAIAKYQILNETRSQAAEKLGIQDVFNPVRRAENLQALKDYIEKERPATTGPETKSIAAGNLPMGEKTVLKGGEWLDVHYDEESGKIVLKDGRTFSVAPDEKIEVEQTRVPKEVAPKPPAENLHAPTVPGKISPEQSMILEQIRKENPEEYSRIMRGNTAQMIQDYEAKRLAKSRQMQQGEIFPEEKAQNKLFAPQANEGNFGLDQTWKDNLFKENQQADEALRFLATKSPDTAVRTLGQVLLMDDRIAKQLKDLPITTNTEGKTTPEPGAYSTKLHTIRLDPDIMGLYNRDQAASLTIHEILHGLTAKKMTETDRADLRILMDKAIEALPESERQVLSNGPLPSYDRDYLNQQGLQSQGRRVYYGLQSPEEFLAEAFSSPDMGQYLKSIPEVTGLGKRGSLWDRFIEWMNRVIFDKSDHRSLLNQVLEKGGDLMIREPEAAVVAKNATTATIKIPTTAEETVKTIPSIPTRIEQAKRDQGEIFKSLREANIPEEMRLNIQAMHDPTMENLAAADKGFISWMKDKVGIIHIPNKDLTRAEQYLSLPVYLKNKFPIFGKLLDIQTVGREEPRSQIIQDFNKMAEPFLLLKGKDLASVERALIEGDKEKVIYDDATLRGERFGLSDRGVQAYNSVRQTLDAIFNRWTDHAEWSLLHRFEEKLTQDEYVQLSNIYNQELTPADVAALPDNVRKAYERIQPGVNLVKDLRSRVAELAGYFPHWRQEGKFYVAMMEPVLNQDGTPAIDVNGQPKQRPVYTKFFNNSIEVTKAIKELEKIKKPNETIAYGRHTAEQETSFFGVSDKNLQRLIDSSIEEVRKQGKITDEQADGLRNSLADSLAETLLSRGAGARMIKRSRTLIEGYETTGLREVLSNYITGYAGMETKQDAAYEFMKALSGVPKDTPKVFQEASHYVDTMLRNYDKEDKFFGKMRGLAFMYYLAASIRSGFVNLTQNFQTGIPFLARELKGMGKGPLGAERIMTKAMWDVAMGRLTEKERFMDNELLSKGITNDQYMRQISREVGGKFEGTLGKVSEIISAPFSKAEIFNRRSAALAAFRVYKDQGLNFEESLGKIRDFIDKTHYLMTKANLPHAMRGGDIPSKLLGTAYTFRRFNHNYILSMVESLRGTDGKFHLANIDVLARSLTWLTILGGISSIPFADDILDQLEKMTGIPYRSNMRKWMREVGGDALERMGTAGIPALLGQIPGMVGTDISGSLNIGLPNLSQPTQGASETVFGVWGGLAKKAANAYQSVGRGDYLRAVEYASPIFLENLLKAVRMSTVGATTPTGRILYDEKGQPIKMTGREAAAQMMSFRPERIAALSMTHRTFSNVEQYFNDQKTNLYDRFRLAQTAEERTDVIKDVQKYNLTASKYKGAVPLVNAESLRRSFVQKPEKKYLIFGAQS